MEFSGARSRNLHNRSVASHKFLFGAHKRRDDISDLRVALHLLFCAKLAMRRRALRFGYFQAVNWRFRCGFNYRVIEGIFAVCRSCDN